ncbi:MAG: 1-deoxy-D-xylulose-5-phosphate synthase [Muribaculaceae bacterium]|nr:1-deoxy-D-xylulose-5-phosphate synthase [Muribaculaceae bacterium]
MDPSTIKSPEDIKRLNVEELAHLSDELRAILVRKLAAHGGHVGPNLGVVEATVALHYVFNAPEDKIVFDVSHQSYVHKMLTGRIGAFIDPTRYDEVTGYTCPRESEYDLFEVGHTSTSIALATGLAKARDLSGGKENVVAFIGDASLGGGMALEALNYAPELGSNIIIVLNDNQMSIAENHGSLYHHLKVLRDSNGTDPENIFKALGYEYVYVRDGNDLNSLIRAFRMVKDAPHAVLVHLNTMKGMGLPPAEAHKERFHFSAPFDVHTGALSSPSYAESYDDIFTMKMLEKMAHDSRVITMTAGTPGAIGFTPEKRAQAGRQFIDVGIAEQDAVTMATGLAKGGARPVMGVVATFLQRAYDQLSHDVAINNLPVVFVEFYGSVFGMNDMTHLGFFDIAMVSNIPNILMLAPASRQEYEAMIDWAVGQTERPVVIRTPGGSIVDQNHPVLEPFTRYDVVRPGREIAIIAEGPFLKNALDAADILVKQGKDPMVINPRILSDVDRETLDSLKGFSHVVTVEDGIIDGGFGQKVAAYLAAEEVKVTCLGLKKEFLDRFKVADVLKANRLTPSQIAETAL